MYRVPLVLVALADMACGIWLFRVGRRTLTSGLSENPLELGAAMIEAFLGLSTCAMGLAALWWTWRAGNSTLKSFPRRLLTTTLLFIVTGCLPLALTAWLVL
ncbi:hypothetical protein DAT35_52025 [Vitiosangium sp. GDMCC 1.1324]|nr:hypothetical protein DAT35_52025 [Vitiosangium sp. GDMCC 1.1324]